MHLLKKYSLTLQDRIQEHNTDPTSEANMFCCYMLLKAGSLASLTPGEACKFQATVFTFIHGVLVPQNCMEA